MIVLSTLLLVSSAEDSAGMQREYRDFLDSVPWFLAKLVLLMTALSLALSTLMAFFVRRSRRTQQAAADREAWVAAAVAKGTSHRRPALSAGSALEAEGPAERTPKGPAGSSS
jgi:heme/copper-type cytochrome/quinol oxidase subunit 2